MIRPTGVETERWEKHGYLVFENAIQGEELRRLQEVFDYWAERCKSSWLDRVDAGEVPASFYDIPDPFDKDEIFVDLIDHRSYYGYLMAFTGDDLVLLGPQVRTVPPGPVCYSGWHPDVPHDNPLHIKVQIYVNDVEPGAGEFAYVPGSHKSDAGPYSSATRLEAMPGHKRFSGKAGTAIMFNAYGWHTAMDNYTDTPRKSLILIYEKWTPERVDPTRFATIAHLCTTSARRRLFGLEG